MSSTRIDDFPSLAVFGERLAEVAATHAPPPQPHGHAHRMAIVVLTALGLGLVASAAAAATLLALNGSAIPPFARADDAASIRPIAGTAVVPAVRGADPSAGTDPWAVRISRGPSATACIAVGQVRAGAFGLVGVDGRFRTLPVRGTDSCGAPPAVGSPIAAVRQFDGRHPRDARTVVYGLGGPTLRSVRVTTSGGERPRIVPVSPQGAFVTAYAGTREELRPQALLVYAGGRTVVQQFGTSPYLVKDLGFLSFTQWRTRFYRAGQDMRCVFVAPLPQRHPPVSGPSACGAADGLFFDSAALHSGDHGAGSGPYRGYRWRGDGTFTWGHAPRGSRVALLGVAGAAQPPGQAAPYALPLAPDGTFAAVLPYRMTPSQVRLSVTTPSGHRHVYPIAHGLSFRGSTR